MSKKNKLPANEIGWFKPGVKPVNGPGVYRTRAKCLGRGYSFWDGSQWGNQRPEPELALNVGIMLGPSGEQEKEWAGRADWSLPAFDRIEE